MKLPSIICLSLLLSSFSSWAIEKGDTLPKIFGRTLEQKLFFVDKEKKDIKIVNFFSIECVPCRKELPYLAKLQKQFPAVGVYAIHVGKNTKRDDEYSIYEVKEFIEKLPSAPKPIVWASSSVQQRISSKPLPMPYTLVLDDKNKVLDIVLGYSEKTKKTLAKYTR